MSDTVTVTKQKRLEDSEETAPTPKKTKETTETKTATTSSTTSTTTTTTTTDTTAAEKRFAMKIATTKLEKWLNSFERDDELEHCREFDIDDIGAINFKTNDNQYGIPFTGLLTLINDRELTATNGESDLKMHIESQYGPVNQIADHLEVLAGFLNQGAKLVREAGIDKAPISSALDSEIMDNAEGQYKEELEEDENDDEEGEDEDEDADEDEDEEDDE